MDPLVTTAAQATAAAPVTAAAPAGALATTAVLATSLATTWTGLGVHIGNPKSPDDRNATAKSVIVLVKLTTADNGTPH